MVHICKNCKANFLSLKLYANHFKNVHPHLKRFSCVDKKCQRVYSVLYKHIIHIERDHNYSEEELCETGNTSGSANSEPHHRTCDIDTIDEDLFIIEHSPVQTNDLSKDWIKVILKILSDDRVPRSTAMDFLNNILSFYDKHISSAKDFLEKSENVEDQVSILTNLLSPSYIKSEFLLLKKLNEMKVLINFESVKLGSEFNQGYSVENSINIIRSDYFMEVVNLTQLFTVLFSQTSLLEIILEYIKNIETLSYTISNIIQTPLWKKKKKQFNPENKSNVLLIPLLIYFDDFEYLNPLGSHSGIQKVGAVYIKIMCLPDYISSKLSHILLAMLFFTEDRKKFGNARIFKVLIDKLNNLQNEGININYKNYNTIKLISCVVTGDNLGVNSILGFSESFNSLHYCRFCRCNSNDMKCQLFEQIEHLRNICNYEEDVNINNINSTGIKEQSIWNTLTNFHVVENFSVDCMHDILEGVCHYDLTIILKSFILKEKYFSLHQLNRRIEIYNFGPSAQKPPLLNSDSLLKGKFKLSASEMLVFVIHLPLIIGDLIPTTSIEWKFFLSLREIVSLVFRKKIHINSTTYLKQLIANHNSLYISISESNLKPKFHFMLHYSKIIENIGPIVAISSMRFEAKHQTFKKCGYVSNNRRNILKTMNIKHQLKVSNLILNYEEFNRTSVTHGSYIYLDKCEFLKYNLISNERNKIFRISWLNYKNLLLKVNMVLCIGLYGNDDPMFGLINHLIFSNNNYYICYELLETQFFNTHYFAYQIIKTDMFFVLNLKDLKYWHTSHISTCANGYNYIIWDF